MKKIEISCLDKFKGGKYDIPIQLDISAEGKDTIKTHADAAGVDISKYMRCCAVSPETFIIVDPDGDAARQLIELNDNLCCYLRERNLSDEDVQRLITRVNNVQQYMETIVVQLPEPTTAQGCEEAVAIEPAMKTTHIQFKVNEALREFIEIKAEAVDMSISKFLRVSALATEPVYILGKARWVAKNVVLLQDNVNDFKSNGLIDAKQHLILHRKCADIYNTFIELAQRLTDISTIDNGFSEEV